MIYFFIGEDETAKDLKIAELKKNLPSEEALQFDFQTLWSQALDPKELQRSLMALPAIASKRLLLIREAHRLKEPHKDIIARFVESSAKHLILVLDFFELDLKTAFVRKVTPFVKIVNFKKALKSSVFDMTTSIANRNAAEALKILYALLTEGTHPLQIMGALVWFWGKSRNQLPKKSFERGLETLQEADLNIKRSRLNPQHAVELAVIKLCWLN